MNIIVQYQHLEKTHNLENYARKKLTPIMESMEPDQRRVMLYIGKTRHIYEARLRMTVGGGKQIVLQERGQSMYACVDHLADKLKKVLHRAKEKDLGPRRVHKKVMPHLFVGEINKDEGEFYYAQV